MDWKKEITKRTKELGTYKPSFDVAISNLADILTTRDKAMQQWKDEGEIPTVELTNKATATHPALKLALDCEAAALPYLKELGMTASSHARIKGESSEAPTECVLDDLKSRFKVG